MSSDNEMNLRRQALLLMSYVPEDPDEALKVLAYAAELVRDWMQPREEGRGTVRMHSIGLVRGPANDGGGTKRS